MIRSSSLGQLTVQLILKLMQRHTAIQVKIHIGAYYRAVVIKGGSWVN